MNVSQINWYKTAFRVRGSVIPSVLNRVIVCGAFGLFVSVLDFHDIPVGAKGLVGVIPSTFLGLLLVFRTNTAYDRFWEGRKVWGNIVNNIRNLSRSIWVAIDEIDPIHRTEKEQILRLLVAFAVTTKLHLRSHHINDQLSKLVSPLQLAKLKSMSNPPLEIAFWISDYFQAKQEQGQISLYQMNELQKTLNALVDMLGCCERIVRTPMPLAYAIHLKQLLLLYCFLLPFEVVDELKWMTAPAIAIVGFTLLGIEAIGIEIEDPFGTDSHDLPLDTICTTIEHNIEDLMSIEPHYRRLGVHDIRRGKKSKQLN